MRYFWKFIHNAIAHLFMAWPWEPQWVKTFHSWTETKWTNAEKGQGS